MTFAEKLKSLRKENGLSQEALSKTIEVPLRTYRSWEADGRYPKNRDIYVRLSDALGCDVSYLMSDDAVFISSVNEQYGARGARQAKELLEQTKALFAGGELSEEDQLAFMNDLKDIFMDAKLKAAKYTPKKYLDKNASDDK